MKLTIKQWRGARSLTQIELAEKLGVGRETVIRWENKPSEITIANCYKLAEIFETTLDEIIFLP